MAYHVLYRRRAERDLTELAEAASPEWFDGLADAIDGLAVFPERCAFAPEPVLRQKGIRHLLFGEGRSMYRVLYRVKEARVEVLTIRHAHRKPLER